MLARLLSRKGSESISEAVIIRTTVGRPACDKGRKLDDGDDHLGCQSCRKKGDHLLRLTRNIHDEALSPHSMRKSVHGQQTVGTV